MSRTFARRATAVASTCALFFLGCAAPGGDAGLDSAEQDLVVPAPPVRAAEIGAWTTRIRENARAQGIEALDAYTECAEVTEVTGAYLCGAYSVDTMNRALARASLYAEGVFGHPRGTVASLESDAYREALYRIAGHDIRSEHLLGFWKDAQEACAAQGEAYCPNADEKDYFETYILPMARTRRDFVVITFSLTGSSSPMDIITHEILHAQYFLQPGFREGTDTYWDTHVPEDDKRAITSVLGRSYDVSDPLLLRNEFMAYTLMKGAERNALRAFVPTHGPGLLEALAGHDAAPVDVR